MTPSRSDNSRDARAARDIEWIGRIGENDESALAALVSEYAGWLIDVATPIVASSDLAQDVVQDVFMRLWDIRGTLVIRGSVPGYLYRAVSNRAQNLSAHERAQQSLGVRAQDASGLETPQAQNTGEADIAAEEFWNTLNAALSTLQPRVRDIFLMRAHGDMSYAEIAEAFGIGIPTVRVQMCRATKALARQMASWVDPAQAFDLGPDAPSRDGPV